MKAQALFSILLAAASLAAAAPTQIANEARGQWAPDFSFRGTTSESELAARSGRFIDLPATGNTGAAHHKHGLDLSEEYETAPAAQLARRGSSDYSFLSLTGAGPALVKDGKTGHFRPGVIGAAPKRFAKLGSQRTPSAAEFGAIGVALR